MKHRPDNSKRRRFLRLLGQAAGAGLILPVSGALHARGAARITRVRFEQAASKTRMVLDMDGRVDHHLFRLPNPERVVIDLPNTLFAKNLKFPKPFPPPMRNIRHAVRKEATLRIVLDVDRKDLTVRSFANKKTSATDNQVVIELVNGTAQDVPVKTAQQVVEKKRDLIIAIDAGHGGKDPGAIGKKGTREKDIVLKIARELESLLRKQPGFKPVLIRDGDYFLPLRSRIEKARKHQADLFISIHADAAHNRKAQGSSVFVLSPNGASSEAARWLAAKENSADLIGGVSLDDKGKMLASVLLDLSQRHTNESSHTVAGDLLYELKKVGQVHSRKVEKAGFVVLKSPDIPSVLVESAFLSNSKEEKKLRTKAYQQKIAKAVMKGLQRYYAKYAPEDTVLAQLRSQEHVIRSGETLSGIAHRYQVTLAQLRATNKLQTDKLRIGQVLIIPSS